MSVLLKVSLANRINLAFLQNKIPLIQSIHIINEDEQDLGNLKVKIFSDPSEVLSSSISISLIRSQESFVIENPRIKYSWDFFRKIKEKITGQLFIQLLDEENNVLAEFENEIIIEPESVWLGQQAPIELLASHILPNSEVIQKIIRNAADILKEKTGSSALNGYQSNSQTRVYQIAQAAYLALRQENISYAVPPASFEASGQKVRTPDQILVQGLGTCLDLSLLYVACLEQCGIHGLIFIIEGHAFVGFWLEDKYLPRPFDEDPQFFRKRIELEEIIAIDITGLTSDGEVSFADLEKEASSHFRNEEKFIFGLDISHCRKSIRIHPINESDENKIAFTKRAKREEENFTKREFNTFKLPENSQPRQNEVDKWKDKLLDLSFRNKLLNFRNTKGTIEILCHNPSEIEDILADGSTFELLPKPEPTLLNQSRLDSESILDDQIASSFEKKKLLTKISERNFKSTLNIIYRSAVNTVEETGANTLYLALGILNWKETDGSNVIRKSPILLLPVDLKKKSVGGRFSIALRDDETVINNTLLQKLKRDYDLNFPGLDPLPEDESGVDVMKILNIFRKIIKDKRGWEIKEEVWLSEFSFQKYLMWKELATEYEAMLESPLVRKVMTSENPKSNHSFVTEEEVEKHAHPKNIYCPLSADSSQMAAILSAANGNSFVLQGPPGTGKSQTIANMIAHNIGLGKKVLFVSEKKVALEVVYRRLQQIGIGPYCLELHSKKSEKKEVVKSFHDALEFTAPNLNGEWDQITEELKTTRDNLNHYFKKLHEKSPSNISAFQAFGVASRQTNLPKLELNFKSFVNLPAKDLREINRKLKTWSQYVASLKEEDYLAWTLVQSQEWSNEKEDIFFSKINESIQVLEELKNKKLEQTFPIYEKWTLKKWFTFKSFLSSLKNIPTITLEFIEQQDFKKYKADYIQHLDCLKQQTELRANIEKELKPQVFNDDFYEWNKKYENAQQGFFILKLFKQYKLKKELKPLSKNLLKPLDHYKNIIEDGIHYQENQQKEKNAQDFLERATGERKYKVEEDTEYRKAIDWGENIHINYSKLFATNLNFAEKAKKFIKDLINNKQLISNETTLKRELETSVVLLNKLEENLNILEEKVELNPSYKELTVEVLLKKFTSLKLSANNFRDVTAMNKLKIDLQNSGLGPIFLEVDKGAIAKSEISEVFNYNFHRKWLNEKTNSSEILNNTTGLQLNKLDKNFKSLDNSYRDLTEKALSSKIASGKPQKGSFTLPNSPVGLIIKENKKSRRHLPIRKLLEEIEPVSKLLKPCYLMSPMSVSQYLPVKPDFDIIIFDEASQITPWDAIGALSRSKQAVIVGDTKQLPPTSFFSMKSEDENDEKIDCESILEMFGTMLPEMLLKWHYRSRSESLISFSNQYIYENRLHTFPACNTNDNKVSLNIITDTNAFYDRGNTKQNLGEAKAVVNEVFEILRSKKSTNSIGVVTFSSVQANLINDLIDAQLQLEPSFEENFDVSNSEYVFVKNLENVQGDERDIILFSIGYGKDKEGKINKNFGPLNNSGGERRLNVAVTRARYEVKLFSNFSPREFDTSTSTSEGLKLLKEYLLYAEEGQNTFKKQKNGIKAKPSFFEKELTQALEEKGWEIRPKVGVGGYRVDLGIVHPKDQESYLAGIECDAARYFTANSARDRDILRQSVLEGLGWEILRVWSTDWWYDSKKTLEQLDLQLKKLLENKEEEKSINELQNEEKEKRVSEVKNFPEKENNSKDSYPDFYDPQNLQFETNGDFYYRPSLIKEQLKKIVEELSPISKDECFSILSKAWGFARKGNRIEDYLNKNLDGLHISKYGDKAFIWKDEKDKEEIEILRLPKDNQQRHPLSIAPEELAQGMLPLLQANIQLKKSDLFRQIAKNLGYSRLSKSNYKNMEYALKYLENKRTLVQEDELVKLI